jgi:hypothetical protein
MEKLYQTIQSIVGAKFGQAHSWTVVNKTIDELRLGPSWTKATHGSSVSLTNKKKRVTIKMSLEREVILDREIKPFQFKSEFHKHGTIEEAAETFSTIVQRFN